MRVLAITNMYPPHHYGGYELLCAEAVAGFRAAGHDVLVLTSDIAVPGVTATPEPRSSVRRDLRLYWDDHEIVRPSIRESLRRERANQEALRDAIDACRPTVVSAWHMGTLSLGMLRTCHDLGLPVVAVVADDWLIYGPLVDRWARTCRRLRPLAPVLERVLHVPCRLGDLGTTGTFCFISDATRTTAEQVGRWSFPSSVVGYSGINVDDFPIGAAPARPTWSWKLLHVGRIDDRKGIDTAIRALAHLPPAATLDIVGRGDEAHLAALVALAAELGLTDRVRFAVDERSGLAARYAAADVVLFPPRWAEPFGLVPLEAMACSTPVVATGTGGSAEFLVDGANCLLVPVDDERALADAVQRLADDPVLRATLVRGGHATAEELTLPRWVDFLERWHLAASGEGTPPPPRERIADVLRDKLAQRA